jgi:D-alanine-D-alanine ligase-like ATP-grasp enzyme
MAKTYKQYLKEAGNVHLAYYIEAADILDIDYEVVIYRLMAKFTHQGKHWFIINTVTPLTNSPSATIAKRKNLTNQVLKDFNIPVPEQRSLNSAVEAIQFFGEFKDIVIKPAQQLGGIGVSILPKTEKEVIKAYDIALKENKSKTSTKVLGEEFIRGENYRFLVVGNDVVGIIRRKAAHVIGNGKDNIEKLIEITNEKKKKQVLKPILVDNEVHTKLQNDGLDMQYIPKDGEEVILRYNCNLTTGGTTEECAQETHQYYKDIAVETIKAIGLEFGGVDIIAEDITKPGKCAINEVNYNPGLRLHYHANKGDVVKVAVPIMEYIRDKYLK